MPLSRSALSLKKIFVFWLPLAGTWLMMAFEGPFLAAVISRLPEPKYNLAAYGVAFALAMFFESPIIMMMGASIALAKNRCAFIKLRRFSFGLNAIITLAIGIAVIPAVFHWFAVDLINLPEPIARLTHIATVILLPWPAAIGYRRFYQGLLIRSNRTRMVAFGTVARLAAMVTTSLVLMRFTSLPGAVLGATALSVGVTIETIATRLMAQSSVCQVLQIQPDADDASPELTYRRIFDFYYPLALTSMMGLGVRPVVTFFLGHSRLPVESLAVLPVVLSLEFIFRSLALAFQDTAIALMGDDFSGFAKLKQFAAILAVVVTGGLALIVFTPLASVWFETISGLPQELSALAMRPAQIIALLPGLSLLLVFQRATLVAAMRTRPITVATAIEVSGIMLVLFLLINVFNWVGILAAAVSLVVGRSFSNTFLSWPFRNVLRAKRAAGTGTRR